MSPPPRPARLARDLAAPALCLLAFGLAAALYFREPSPGPTRLSITAGNDRGLRHQLARVLAAEARPLGLTLSIRPTQGSEEALELVDSGALDLALVQGGLELVGRSRLREVAALHVEPLHLLVRPELHAAAEGNLKAALRGKAVNLSEPGSGTHALAVEILEFVGLDAPGAYVERNLSYDDLVAIDDPADLPDAAFMVSSLPSPVARELVGRWGFLLVPLPFAEAFSLDLLQDEEQSTPAGRPEPAARVDRVHVEAATIPAFTYGVQPGVPPTNIETLGTRLLLVARRDVDPEAVARLVEAILSTDFSRVVRPPIDAASLERPPALPWHEGTRRYLDRNKPLLLGDLMDSLEKGVSILGAVLGGLFFLWQWLRQRVRRRLDRGFEAYIRRVTDVEARAMALELAAEIELKELVRLQAELGRLKAEALEKFAQGEIDGEQLMSGFLVHVNDTRAYLTRLILHERENLEERAAAERRTAGSLWHEEVDDDGFEEP